VSTAEILAAVNAIVAAVKEYPALARAVEGVFSSLGAKEDPTPAVKHLEAVAAARALGIPYP
jgi:hypothetical protein